MIVMVVTAELKRKYRLCGGGGRGGGGEKLVKENNRG